MDSDNCRKMYVIGTQEIKGDKVELKRKKKGLRTTVTLKNHKFSCCLYSLFPKVLTGHSENEA